jgi:hypothetical protein
MQETVLAHLTRVFADHGIPEPERQEDGTHVVKIKGIKFAATISTGRHPVSGNLLAIEINAGRSVEDKLLIALTVLAIAAVIVVVAVVAADAMKGGGGGGGGCGGGGGGGGHHHGGCATGNSGPGFIYMGPIHLGGGRRRHRARRHRVAALYSSTVMYNAHVSQAGPPGAAVVVAGPAFVPKGVTDSEWCDSVITKPSRLTSYLFANIRTYLFNAGFTRVPVEAIHRLTAEPLDHRPQEVTLRRGTTRCYTVTVSEHACNGLSDTLRADVMVTAGTKKNRQAKISIAMNAGRPPDLFNPGTKALDLGHNTFAALAGPGQTAALKPGVYYLSVRNSGSTPLRMRIAARLFDGTDKEMMNTALLGGEVTTSTVDTDGDEWELVDTFAAVDIIAHPHTRDARASLLDVSPQEVEGQRRKLAEIAAAHAGGLDPTASGAAAPHPAAAGALDVPPPYPGQVLSQGSDLRDLSDADVIEALVERGVARDTIPLPPQFRRDYFEAMLYPLLPPAEMGSILDAAASGSDSVPEGAEAPEPTAPPAASSPQPWTAEDDDAPPYEFCCPISCPILRDPVIAADGFTYEREDIARWFELHQTSPMTGAEVPHTHLVANISLHAIVRDAASRHPEWSTE